MDDKKTNIVFTIGNLVLAAIAGAVIQNQLTSTFDLSRIYILVLAIFLLVLLVLIRNAYINQRKKTLETKSTLDNIERRLGLKVQYQELKDINGLDEDILANIVKNVEFEMLELAISEIHKPEINIDLPPSQLRQDFYDSIISRVRGQALKGISFNYKRIVQFPTEDENFDSLNDHIYVDHCKQMLSLNEDRGVQAYVKRTLLTSPLSFLIIDRTYLILTIDVIKQENGNQEQHQKGEMIIYDPQQELVRVFLREWNLIENSHLTKTVTIDDLNS